MTNLATALKDEIRRLARKEVRATTGSMKSNAARHRREIAELKREVRDLNKRVAYLTRQEKKRLASPSTSADADRPRFSASWVKKHRERLELSAADYGDLVGVSGLTIYNWEKGKTAPRDKQLAAWGRIRNLGKREAWKRLEMMDA